MLIALLACVPVVTWMIIRWQAMRAVEEWFPMRMGDRWTYRDEYARMPYKIIFEVVDVTVREGHKAFVVERRIASETIVFIVSVRMDGVWIHGTLKEDFSPAFHEFRLPPVQSDEWTYKGRLGNNPLTVTSRINRVTESECEVVEDLSHAGYTTFVIRKGEGVVRLTGKSNDIHGFGLGYGFDWWLEKFERKG